ncbi:hypothetical protein [Bacillus cereus]|uniref:hypothetical protein n=1 Tax=Bacillus cereus TaxID=1396 RepID=UPI0020D20AF0|nr:hypothetical protein [Bacillus cereus]
MSHEIQKSNLLTISDLRKLEKKEKQTYRQSVSSYVKKFREHALEGLLTRK